MIEPTWSQRRNKSLFVSFSSEKEDSFFLLNAAGAEKCVAQRGFACFNHRND
jgi:hypothetical protein